LLTLMSGLECQADTPHNLQDALTAYEAMDGAIFQGRLIHVLPGKRAMAREAEAEDDLDGKGPVGFKEQRAAERKADAGDRSAWSTLYMRQDTVVEAVAALLGVDKSEFLDPEASDVAVRLALGETQVRTKCPACVIVSHLSYCLSFVYQLWLAHLQLAECMVTCCAGIGDRCIVLAE
jgi:hypothetical protein